MKRRGFLTKLGLGMIAAPSVAKAVVDKERIPDSPSELHNAINGLFQNMGKYSTAYTPINGPDIPGTPDGKVVFDTYVNGWIKAEGDEWLPSKPELAISRMWDLVLAEYKSGKRKVWWRITPEIGVDNTTPEREVLRMRLKFT